MTEKLGTSTNNNKQQANNGVNLGKWAEAKQQANNKHLQANILKVSAVAIAAPRYFGAFGASIGANAIDMWPYLVHVEMWTGGAMAILEGFALAFVFGKMRQLDPGDPHYKLLQKLAWFIAATLPLVGLPYLLSEQNDIAVDLLFAGWIGWTLQIAWSLVLLSVPVAVVMAVGYADVDQIEPAKDRLEPDHSPHVCADCGRPFGSVQALNAHGRHCLALNGSVK